MKKRTLLLLTVLLLILLLAPAANAETVPEIKPDVNTPASGNAFAGIYGTFESVSKDAVLKRVNEIRKEAYNEGLVDTYVPIKWSKGLEKIAQVRAAEASVLEAHDRPSGKSIWEMTSDGVSSYGENLAWGTKAIDGINLWYSEKDDYVKGTPNAVTGHYTSLINPYHQYIGIGSFQRNGNWNCVCGEFCGGSALSEGRTGISGTCIQLIEVPAGDASKYAQYGNPEKTDLPKVKLKSVKAAKKAATVKWKKVSKKNLKKVKKIEIQYSTKKNFSKSVKSKFASAKKNSYKIKNLKKGKKYYVRIRAYTSSGSKIHVSKWSSVKSVKAK